MIYIDTSAAVKLVRPERHSKALSDWLRERDRRTVFSSVLIEVDLMRAVRRSAPEKLDRASEVLRGIGVLTLSPAVVQRASEYGDASLRSLDAIHLATAEHLAAAARQPLDALLTYDERLLAAARGARLQASAPGA